MKTDKVIRYALAAWSAINVSFLLLLSLHESVPATVLGRYSPSYTVLLIVALGLTLASLVGTALAWSGRLSELHWVRERLSSRLAWGLGLCLLGAAAVWWLVWPEPLYVYPFNLFYIYIAVWAVGTGALGLAVSKTGTGQVTDKWFRVTMLIGLVVGGVLTFSFIDRIPPPVIDDEPVLASAALSCRDDGRLSRPVAPVRDVAPELTIPAILCLHGQITRLLPPTPEVLRMVGVGLVWLGIPLVIGLLKTQFGWAAAVAGALVMGLFPLMHAYIRPEMFVAFCLALGLLGYTFGLRTGRWSWDVMAGLALVLAIEGNQMSVRFIAAFGLVYLWDAWQAQDKRPWWRNTRLLAFGTGVGLGLVGYYVFHVVGMAQTDLFGAIQMMQRRYDIESNLGGNVTGLDRFVQGALQWSRTYVSRYPVELMCLALGVMTVFVSPSPYLRRVLLVFVVGTLLLFIINPKPGAYSYWIHHLPLVAVLFAAFVHKLAAVSQARAAMYVLIALVVLHTASVARYSQITQNANAMIAIGYDLEALLPPEVEVVYGDPPFFYGLYRRTFLLSYGISGYPDSESMASRAMKMPQALLFTLEWYDLTIINEYIAQLEMVEVAEFEHNQYGRVTKLYVLPEFAEPVCERLRTPPVVIRSTVRSFCG